MLSSIYDMNKKKTAKAYNILQNIIIHINIKFTQSNCKPKMYYKKYL